ncbi:MAG: response regulator [Thermosynechococcaceae cyanobacterium]
MNEQAIHILLVEDNPGDAFLISNAFQQRSATVLHQVTNGKDALHFLHQPSRTSPLPNLILLDLNLPQMSGHEVLEAIKTDPDLLHIPVIVLSTSHAQDDVLRSYQLHANCYLTKPLNLQDTTTMMKSLEQFWLLRASLPQHPKLASL